MSSETKKDVDDLWLAVDKHIKSNADKSLKDTVAATQNLRFWLGYLRSSVSTETADRLLDAAQATIIEVAGCLSLGLVRPAIFSIRTQLELLCAWIYFNDHAVEWKHTEETGDDYPMRSKLLKYMVTNDRNFDRRFKLLQKKRTRQLEDPYAVLSTHVHSTSSLAAPKVSPLASIIQPQGACDECVKLQAEVQEYLCDILSSWYADHWFDLPKEITNSVKQRLTAKELKEFCASQ